MPEDAPYDPTNLRRYALTAHSSVSPSPPPRTHAAARSSRRFALGLTLILLVGVLVRLPFLPRLGHAYDQDEYRIWMGAIQDRGLARVYEGTNADYIGYHYILWLLAKGYGERASQVTVRDKELRLWLKLPGLAGDLLAASLVGVLARSLARGRETALGTSLRRAAARRALSPAEAAGLAAAALFLFHPAVLYAGSYWGQQDSLVTFFMLLACWLAWGRRSGWAGAILAVGVLVKPQPLLLGPLLAWVVWRRSAWPGLLRGALAGAAVLLAGHAFFLLTGSGERVLHVYALQFTQDEHLSFNAYNLWWPAERLLGARPTTALVALGGLSITYGAAALALVGAVLILTWRALQREDAPGMLLAGGYFIAAYFLVASASHERYVLPAFAFLLPVLAFTPRLRLPLLVLSLTATLNLLIGLPLDRRWPQGDPVWLSVVIAVAATAAVFMLTWLIPFAPTGTLAGSAAAAAALDSPRSVPRSPSDPASPPRA